ncbi:MAG: hypothetical protein ABI758_00400 [Candidatus Woesebacteria bacterium]
MSQNRELLPSPETQFPQIIVIDFDRTLGDVEASMERFYQAATLVGIETDDIKEARKKVEDDGGSFEPLRYVKQKLSTDTYGQFREHFVYASTPAILYPDAPAFLETVKNVPHCVLTYGVNAEWQELKIAASGYTGPFTVTAAAKKGKMLSTWKNADNEYVLQRENGIQVSAPSLCLIDDKASAFEGLGTDCSGFLLQREGFLLASQRGEIPAGVTVIRSLSELAIVDNQLQKVEI